MSLRENRLVTKLSHTSEVDELLLRLDKDSHRRKPTLQHDYFMVWGCICIPIAIWSLLVIAFNFSQSSSLREIAFPTFFALVSGVSTWQLRKFTASRRQVEAIKYLSWTEDVRAVPVLVDALVWRHAEAQKWAQSGLTRLLPHVAKQAVGLLSNQQRQILDAHLTLRDVLLTLSILDMLEQCDDEQSIRAVRRLVHQRPYNLDHERLIERAKACLTRLELRASPESTRLLRPANDDGIDSLLRPLSSVDTATQLLLRPPGT